MEGCARRWQGVVVLNDCSGRGAMAACPVWGRVILGSSPSVPIACDSRRLFGVNR